MEDPRDRGDVLWSVIRRRPKRNNDPATGVEGMFSWSLTTKTISEEIVMQPAVRGVVSTVTDHENHPLQKTAIQPVV